MGEGNKILRSRLDTVVQLVEMNDPLAEKKLVAERLGQKEKEPNHFSYRDLVYIRKDIISTLVRHGELGQSKLMSYCNLNNVKHKQVLLYLVEKGMILKNVDSWGGKTIIKYIASENGLMFLQDVLQPYEHLFPRNKAIAVNDPTARSREEQ